MVFTKNSEIQKMRDLLKSDRIANDFRSIEDEHGSFIPMCWSDPKDWARWWLRQEELHDFICLTAEQRELFNQILAEKPPQQRLDIDRAIEIYQAADEEHGFEDRRYDACIGELGGVVAIADEEGDNGSSLKMYRSEKFIAWMAAAQDGVAAGRFSDLCEAINETRIVPDLTDGH